MAKVERVLLSLGGRDRRRRVRRRNDADSMASAP